MHKWLLPDAIDDLLPDEAIVVERLRRVLLDHFGGAGYRLVRPPLVEHLESLLTGSGRDLELQTFKVVDPMSGHLLGVRADITPQVARIDAHLLNETGPTRLCYAGSVLRTSSGGPGATREVMQVGAELFGEPGIEADREVITLLASALCAAGVQQVHLDLGHVGIYRALAAGAGLAGNGESEDVFDALRLKDRPAVTALTSRLPRAWGDAMVALTTLYGPAAEVLAAARRTLPDIPAVANALATLEDLAASAAAQVHEIHVDLGDLRGYHYHNGVIFSSYVTGSPTPVGNGGRYDGIGRAFGRSRPATGFTLYLRQLTGLIGGT